MDQGTGTLALLIRSQGGVGAGQLPHHGVSRHLGTGEVCPAPPSYPAPPPINGRTSGFCQCLEECAPTEVSPCLVAFVYEEETAMKKKGKNKV